MVRLEDKKSGTTLLTLGALGVVFGDIGTSPLYALQECFAHGLAPTPDHVLGVLSLIFWGLMIIVSTKYICVVMNADNHGEGGTFSLTSLASRSARQFSRGTTAIVLIGFCGASLFCGDSLITPAISILSAVEGLKVAAPSLSPFILPIAVSIIIFLFLFQRHGTQKVGNYFGPIMVIWFSTIGFVGLLEVIERPGVLWALSPVYGLRFLAENGWHGFTILGSVLLAFTGAEALYADMGHFGSRPIRMAWFLLVLPGLTLSYFGQGALVLYRPETIDNPFYKIVPEDFLIGMVILASASTVIASQAVISGAFSMVQQAIQLGFLPRMKIRHTSASQYGQIYISRVNWILCIGVLVLVSLFRTSSSLANAYGFAVMGTMITTTLLVAYVARFIWNWSRLRVLAAMSVFFVVDCTLFSTAVIKIPDGGWLPLLIGALVFMVFMTWRQGRDIVMSRRRGLARKLETFVENLEPGETIRVPGTAVYLSTLRAVVPMTLINNLRHNKVLHERVLILHVSNEEEPRVPEENRLTVKPLQHGFWQVTLHYGFMERPNVMADLQAYLLADCPIETEDTSFFLGHDVYVKGDQSLKPIWREKLFLWLANGAADMSDYFRIPTERVVEFGIQIKV